MNNTNKLIEYRKFCNEVMKYTNFITSLGSEEYMINRWLKPICSYAKEQSEFYNTRKERDCGWYVEKEKILKMLKETIPYRNDKINLILNNLCTYIVEYKEPKPIL